MLVLSAVGDVPPVVVVAAAVTTDDDLSASGVIVAAATVSDASAVTFATSTVTFSIPIPSVPAVASSLGHPAGERKE